MSRIHIPTQDEPCYLYNRQAMLVSCVTIHRVSTTLTDLATVWYTHDIDGDDAVISRTHTAPDRFFPRTADGLRALREVVNKDVDELIQQVDDLTVEDTESTPLFPLEAAC